MNDIFQEIQDLINTRGQTAPNMTKALKNIGNGDMHAGIKKMAKYFMDTGNESGFVQGMKLGEQRGVIKGSLATLGMVSLVVGGMYIKDKYKEYKRKRILEQEGQAILEAIKETIPVVERNREDVDKVDKTT